MPSKTEVSERALRAAQDATYAVRHGRSLGSVAEAIDRHFVGHEEVVDTLRSILAYSHSLSGRTFNWKHWEDIEARAESALRRAEPVEERK